VIWKQLDKTGWAHKSVLDRARELAEEAEHDLQREEVRMHVLACRCWYVRV
jgi:hypothetical protein